jgi:hypothetical protein
MAMDCSGCLVGARGVRGDAVILLALFLAAADPAPIDWPSVCRDVDRRIEEVGEREAIRQARAQGFTWAQIAKARIRCKLLRRQG